MKKILTLLVVIFTLTACSSPVVGTVVDKDHQAGRWDNYMRSQSYSCGSRTVSTGTGKNRRTYSTTKYCSRLVPDRRWISERWSVFVKDDRGDIHTVPVNRKTYASLRKGSYFDNRKN